MSIQTEHDRVAADPTEIHQVLMNLVTNAIYAMHDTGGALELKLTDFTIARKGRGEFPQLEPGRYLRLSVKDSGTGMDAATLEHLFEPFFTTKRGEGTGMGLAVVHGIVTSLKGTISVESVPGKGSTFHVILPAAEAEVLATSEGTAHIPTGTERILFVDDDVEINRMAAPLLRSLGYRPTCVMSGVEALELLRQNPDAFDLVITDIIMPELSGDRLAAEIHRLKPKLPILLCTGFSDVMMTDRISELGVQGILRKPLMRRELAQMIRTALGRQC
ncbi:MAG: ATP-binding protein [Kiritimatiellia bacterium]